MPRDSSTFAMPIYRRRIIKGGIIACLTSLAGCQSDFPREMDDTATPTPKPMTPFDGTEPETFSDVDRQNLERTIHRLVNDRRNEHDLHPLDFDEELAYIARTKSRDMAIKGYYSHKEPDGDTFTDRLREYGYDWQYTSENLEKHYAERNTPISEIAKRAVSSWMRSQPHRENMLLPSFNVQGIGAYVNEDYTVYITQLFDEIRKTPPGQTN